MTFQQAVHGGKARQSKKPAQGPRGLPVVGVLPALWLNPLDFFERASKEFGGVVTLNLGLGKAYLLNHPAHVKHVLQDNHRNYRKSPFIQKLKPLLGEGLLTSDDDLWRRQRRLIQPAFHRDSLEQLTGTLGEVITRMLDRWRTAARDTGKLDVADEMSRVALEMIVQAMFSTDISDRAADVGQAITVLQEYTSSRMWAFSSLAEKLPTKKNREFRQALARLDSIVYDIIEQRKRRQNRGSKRDLLDLLMAATDENGERMSPRQLRDEVMTMFAAGHETTANAMAWLWYLLSQHADIEENVRAEVRSVLNGRVPQFSDLPALAYTKRVIQESLRLMPTIWWYARTAIEDDQLGGFEVPAGATVILSQYVIHRHASFWSDPETFDPDRFLPERLQGTQRFAYFPFGAGPRTCIGGQLAMMEMQLLLALVMPVFRLELAPGAKVEPAAMITMRPRYGLPMLLNCADEADTLKESA